MKAWESVGNVTGTFPTAVAKMSSGSGTTDGTPLASDSLNNVWGFVQDLMNRAGLTPSGVLEAYAAETGALPLGTTATQIRTAFQLGGFGDPGEAVFWFRSQSPAIVGARILLLQGQTIAISSYKDLVAATYCGDGVNNTAGVPFYKSSDSGGVTRSISGTYFTLPDARGITIRGVDVGNVHDPGGSARGGGTPNGSLQTDAMQGHYHGASASTTYPFYGYQGAGAYGFAAGGLTFLNDSISVTVTSPTTDGSHGTPRTDSETRMINLACYIGIRFQNMEEENFIFGGKLSLKEIKKNLESILATVDWTRRPKEFVIRTSGDFNEILTPLAEHLLEIVVPAGFLYGLRGAIPYAGAEGIIVKLIYADDPETKG